MSSDDSTLPALPTRDRERRNRERRYDRFPSRKRERSPTIAGDESHAAFLPSTKPEGANKELRTRAAASYKKRRDHFSRGRPNKTRRPRPGGRVTRWRAEIPPPRFFPENFRRVTLAYFGGSDSFASGLAAVWDLTNPTARHADGINRIDVARIRPILGYYVSTLAVTFYLAAAFLACCFRAESAWYYEIGSYCEKLFSEKSRCRKSIC